ncbi:putative SAM-dependent methyltransferase [Pseudomonas coronafaciens pv. porri]|nr:putative SAM-dependent methyltransferase [Pseudomonas coronafaciens pv. porri]RMT01042.1 putative SAM-dependent methyltransferase [Pseudomonas coronafaciens pv. oryzae]
MCRRRLLEHQLRAKRLVQHVGAIAARIQWPGHEFPERVKVLKHGSIRLVMMRRAVMDIGGQPDTIANLLRAQVRQQLGNLQLPAERRAIIAVGNGLPTRDTGAHLAIRHAQTDRHVSGNDFPLRTRRAEFALEPVELLTTKKSGGRARLVGQVGVIAVAVAAHVEDEHIEHRAIGDLAVDAPALVRLLQAQRRVFQIRLTGTRGQQLNILDLVTIIQLFAGRPVVGDFVVVPLPDLRHFGIEAAHVFIHQIVAVIAPVFVEGLRHLAFCLGGNVAPDAAPFGSELLRHRAVGVDGVAAVDKKIGQAQTHRFVDTHAANVGIDAKALPDRVTTPDETNVTTLLRHAAQMAEPWFADHTALCIFKRNAVENRLIDRQSAQFDARGEIGALISERRHHPTRLGKHTARVPLNDHARRPIAAAPDDCLVAEYVTGLNTVSHLWPVLDGCDNCRRNARQHQTRPDGPDCLNDTATLEIELAHGYPLTDRQKSNLAGQCWHCVTAPPRLPDSRTDGKNLWRPVTGKLPRLIPARGAQHVFLESGARRRPRQSPTIAWRTAQAGYGLLSTVSRQPGRRQRADHRPLRPAVAGAEFPHPPGSRGIARFACAGQCLPGAGNPAGL